MSSVVQLVSPSVAVMIILAVPKAYFENQALWLLPVTLGLTILGLLMILNNLKLYFQYQKTYFEYQSIDLVHPHSLKHQRSYYPITGQSFTGTTIT